MNVFIRNIGVLVIASLVYTAACFARSDFPFLFLVGVPIVVGVATYLLVVGKPSQKRIAAGLVPLIALLWIAAVLDVRDFAGVAVFHAFAIGIIVVQLFEVFSTSFFYMARKMKKASNRH